MSSDDGAPTKAADTGGKYHLTSADCFIDWLAPSEDGHCFFSAVAGLSAICVGYSSSGTVCVLGVWLSDGRDDSDSWRATSAVAMLVGVCLGHWGGFVVNAIGLTLGNLLQVQLLTRVRDRRHKKPDSRVYRALVKMRHPAVGVLIGYAVPMIPTAFVNLAAGDTHLTAKAQSWACLAGSTIVTFIYAFAGDLLILKQDWKSLLILLTIAVVIGLAEYGIRMRRDAVVRGTD